MTEPRRKFNNVVDELMRVGLLAETVPLDESDTTRTVFMQLDDLWIEALTIYKESLGDPCK